MLWRKRAQPKTRKELGSISEDHAARFLTSKGYRIKERNFRTARGEIDIIAEQRDVLVFIEVKSRSSDEHGRPLESVTSPKQRTIAAVAGSYISTREKRERLTRYDIVEVHITPAGRVTKVEVIEGAFRG